MTWALTAEEIAFPTLLPPIPVRHDPISSEVQSTVGFTWANFFARQGDESYAGPVDPVQQQTSSAWGPVGPAWYNRYMDDYQARPPSAFHPLMTKDYETAMFVTTERVQPFFVDPNESLDTLNGVLGETEWYETTGGAVVLGLGVGVVSYLATRAFLRSRDRR